LHILSLFSSQFGYSIKPSLSSAFPRLTGVFHSKKLGARPRKVGKVGTLILWEVKIEGVG